MKKSTVISILRLKARIIGTLVVAFTLFIGIGEMLESFNKHGVSVLETFDALIIISFVFWGAGLAGLILALWKEGLGGIISFGSFIIFIVLVGVNPNPDVNYTPILFIFLIPSVLYLCYWWLTQKA